MPFPQAALEKRLTVCCFLGAGAPKGSRACSSCLEVYVGAFSAFFNFIQLTEARRGRSLLNRRCRWMMFCLTATRPSPWTSLGPWNLGSHGRFAAL